MSAAAVSAASASSTVGSSAQQTLQQTKPAVCRFFLRGICRFGSMCRFSHDLNEVEGETAGPSSSSTTINCTSIAAKTTKTTDSDNNSDGDQPKPSTSRSNWANAPIFVPNRALAAQLEEAEDVAEGAAALTNKSWADVAGLGLLRGPVSAQTGFVDMVCPYEHPCPYGDYCAYAIHLEMCDMCQLFCLHPSDQAQRRKHNKECLQQHEQAMELSFAIAQSKDKTCGICFDTIMEKSGREKRFGILPNCSHIFCLECIRKWRQAKQFEHKITRSCPECRVSSDFVCPSAFWVETKEEKEKLLNDYRSALGIKDCKYFKKGDGKCPFGNKCFYKHALPNGKLVDVGCPKRARKLMRNPNEIIDLLDIYLWEFVEHRDYHWLDFLSPSSDDSDDSEFSDDD